MKIRAHLTLIAIATLLPVVVFSAMAVNKLMDAERQSAIKNLQGEFSQNANLLSAGSLIIAIPTLVVYLVLQRQFIAGLTLGSTKG